MPNRLGAVAAWGLLAVACVSPAQSSSSTFATLVLSVQNIDGPPVSVALNGTVIGTFTCGGAGLTVTRESPDVPELPWSVRVLASDGSELDRQIVSAPNRYAYYIRRYGSMFEAGPAQNPGPGPMLPCPSLYFDTPQPN
jgi:hypothetical protein